MSTGACLPPDTPPAIRRLVERCLQKDPKRRLRDIGDAWIEIDSPAAVSQTADAAPPAAPSRIPWIAAGAAALIAVAALAWGLSHRQTAVAQPVVRWSYSQERPYVAFKLSRDGSKLVYMEINGNTYSLALRMMDQLEPKPIPDLVGAALPTFSPDGQWIAFVSLSSSNKIQKMPITGGTPITLCEYTGNGSGLTWGDDGNIYFQRRQRSCCASPPRAARRRRSPSWIPARTSRPTAGPSSCPAATRFSSVFAAAARLKWPWSISTSTPPACSCPTPPHRYTRHPATWSTTGMERSSPRPSTPRNCNSPDPKSPVVERVGAINNDGADYTVSDGGTSRLYAWRRQLRRRSHRPELGRPQRYARTTERAERLGHRPALAGHDTRRQRNPQRRLQRTSGPTIWCGALPLASPSRARIPIPSGRPTAAGSPTSEPARARARSTA